MPPKRCADDHWLTVMAALPTVHVSPAKPEFLSFLTALRTLRTASSYLLAPKTFKTSRFFGESNFTFNLKLPAEVVTEVGRRPLENLPTICSAERSLPLATAHI